MGVKSLFSKVGTGISNTISKAAVLSPAQLEEIYKKKQEYLLEKPDPNSQESLDLVEKLLGALGVEIHSEYLSHIQEIYDPVDVDAEYGGKFDVEHNIKYFNITKWVIDKEENSLEKLVNVYENLSNENCNIALVFDRKMNETNVYLAVVNLDNSDIHNNSRDYKKRLLSAIKGNFPGTCCANMKDDEGIGVLPCLDNNTNYSISSISNLPSEKSEKFLNQTIEKLIDGIVPQNRKEEYILVLLATPMIDIETRKLRLGEYYSGLAPYASWQTTFNTSESTSLNSMFTLGANVGVSGGINKGINQSLTNTEGTSHSTTDTISDTTSESKSKGTNKLNAKSVIGQSAMGVGGALLGVGAATSAAGIGVPLLVAGAVATGAGAIINAVGMVKEGTISDSTTDSKSRSTSRSETDTVSQSQSNTQGASKGNFMSMNFGINFARSSSATAMVGKSDGINQTYVNYAVKHTLDVLEQQMKRLEQGTALGMWDFCAYVLSEDYTMVNNVAHSYLSLTEGETSFLSKSSINLWNASLEKYENQSKEICAYLKQLRHPMFALKPEMLKENRSFYIYPTTIDATTSLSGKELAYSLNFPKKSITGMPVIECAPFGRNISTFDSIKKDNQLNIGKVFHMYHQEDIDVDLTKKSLASHTFITGSTGSGKSNTVYQLLNEVIKNDVKFMVVEPTKGEYKDVFCSGDNPVAKVYGTNPSKTPLLRINPFSFPKDIHVFEHMDRLVEIFNVCWPMYAAMPAVLKSAIEKAYEDCGWDLIDSKNKYNDNYYPNFKDVVRNVKLIIESSEYDNDNKGAYKGSLITRLQSLTNGINGLIFTNDEIDLKDLFDENVIIDISRVGSNETKSLIMGMMVLKLQEHRISNHQGMNESLKHVTVLEEAHYLLKRTSTEQVMESSNLIGKSVEMISNAIAEMRTYGEGFIIVDQSPGLLDMSAIRNTNTKIIMRLPDETDRRLVGKSANLNDNQIIELAKLPCGVAAIYQNEWIEPVLCKVNEYITKQEHYSYQNVNNHIKEINNDELIDIFSLLSNGTRITDQNRINDIKECLFKNEVGASTIVAIVDLLRKPAKEPRISKLAPIVASMFPLFMQSVRDICNNTSSYKEWTDSATEVLQLMINKEINLQLRINLIYSAIMQYFGIESSKYDIVKDYWQHKGGLI